MNVRTATVVAGFVIVAGVTIVAQQTISKMGDTVKTTATIEQIDLTNRIITFKNEDGTEDKVWASADFKRFDELKVGDKVSMTYYQSKVYRIRKPGDPPLDIKSGSAVTGTSGTLPGGTLATQSVTTVTVDAVDPDAGSITVTTSDGRTIMRKVEDKANLAGVKPGDKIDIVFTQALLANIERSK